MRGDSAIFFCASAVAFPFLFSGCAQESSIYAVPMVEGDQPTAGCFRIYDVVRVRYFCRRSWRPTSCSGSPAQTPSRNRQKGGRPLPGADNPKDRTTTIAHPPLYGRWRAHLPGRGESRSRRATGRSCRLSFRRHRCRCPSARRLSGARPTITWCWAPTTAPVGRSWRTDVVIIVGVDRANNRLAVFSIPRDTYVQIPDYGWGRINQVDYLGEKANPGGGGPKLMSQVLQDTLGITTNHWVRVRMDGFIDVVNAVGGVTVHLDCAFYEPIFNLTTNAWDYFALPAGDVWMDGDTAYWFVRLRYRESDIGRNRRQRQFLWALRDQVRRPTWSPGCRNSTAPSRVPFRANERARHARSDVVGYQPRRRQCARRRAESLICRTTPPPRALPSCASPTRACAQRS